eukprot:7390134-Prymnesium_polylepis.1
MLQHTCGHIVFTPGGQRGDTHTPDAHAPCFVIHPHAGGLPGLCLRALFGHVRAAAARASGQDLARQE